MNEESSSPILTEIPRYIAPQPFRYVGPAPTAQTAPIPLINWVLFALTLLTTTMAGAEMAGASHLLLQPSGLLQGLSFSIPLMAILLVHEMGHYVTARRNRVNASWPYFIPAPWPSLFLIGTFGAFIRLRELPRSRRVMFDIGAAGPWAGAILAIIAVVVGLHLSQVAPLEQSAGGLELGNSLLFWGLAHWILGVNPNSVTINLHPIAFAGWIGLFVTTLNLLPVGQLDGGHVIYALFGHWHRAISWLFIVACVLLAVIPAARGHSFWGGWLLWAGLLLILGVGHPTTLEDAPLDKRRRCAAWLTIALFIVTFSPVPLSISPPAQTPPPARSYDVVLHPVTAHSQWIRL